MPTIEFQSNTNYDLFRPVLAKEHVPDWWKYGKATSAVSGQYVGTVRQCPGMDDMLKYGWYFLSDFDIRVYPTKNSDCEDIDIDLHDGVDEFDNMHWMLEILDDRFPYQDTSGHHHQQVWGQWKTAVKFITNWSIRTPPGYSVIYMNPFLFNNPNFEVWPGMIDTDTFNQCGDTKPLILNVKTNKEFIIKKGEPILHVFPFKREKWVASYPNYTFSSYYNNMSLDFNESEMPILTDEEKSVMGKPNTGKYCPYSYYRPANQTSEYSGYKKTGAWYNKKDFFTDLPDGGESSHQLEFEF